MDIRKVKKLIEFVNENDLIELEIHEDKESVRITRGKAEPQIMPLQTQPAPIIETIKPPVTIEEPAETAGYAIKAPMVGTVFLAPSPGTKPFVEIGQQVAIGDTLCLIEAMKMFNQVEADKAGIISACLVENAHPVEYDQPLFVIEEK